jgi:hypothetical protein
MQGSGVANPQVHFAEEVAPLLKRVFRTQGVGGPGTGWPADPEERKAEARRRMEARNAPAVAVELTKSGQVRKLYPSEPKSP